MIQRTTAVAVFGASGHTGKFVVGELHRRGLRAIRIGRDLQTLEIHSDPAWDDEIRVANVESSDSLDAALKGASVVINCAGPFLDTALPVLDAALRAGIPYVDVAAEQAIVRTIFDTRHQAARDAGVAVVPAMAFYGGLADLLASALVEDTETVDEIDVVIGLDSWHPTQGTRLTGQRNNVPRVIQRGGRLELVPNSPRKGHWDFPEPIGRREIVGQPFSEVITIASHLNVDTISPWINVEPLQDLRDTSTPPPELEDQSGRSSQRFAMDVVVRSGEARRTARAQGRDIYHLTAPLAVEAALRLLSGETKYPSGVHAPGAMFDAKSFLDGLDVADFEVSYGESL
jgi:short subunit dehydrogenase-like uncharacterized protein